MYKGSDQTQHFRFNTVPAVGVQKTAAEGIGFQIEKKCPDTPENIHMPVTDTAIAQIDKTAEIPVIQHDVGQTIIAVKQSVGF